MKIFISASKRLIFLPMFCACAFAQNDDPFGSDGVDDAQLMEDARKALVMIAEAEKLFGYAEGASQAGGCMGYSPQSAPPFGVSAVAKDPAKAFEIASKIAETAAHSESVVWLANCYVNGIGVKKDLRAVAEIYISLQDAPYRHAQMPALAYMAYAYENGLGVKKDAKFAEKQWNEFYKCLKSHEDFFAVRDVASRFYNGFGFIKDRARAVEILERAYEATLGNAEFLGDCSFLPLICDYYSGKFDKADANPEKLAKYKKLLDEENAKAETARELIKKEQGKGDIQVVPLD